MITTPTRDVEYELELAHPRPLHPLPLDPRRCSFSQPFTSLHYQ
jgi:hypothetical protein